MSQCKPGAALEGELVRCLSGLRTTISPASVARLEPTWARFAAFAAASGADSFADVTPAMAAAFVTSRTTSSGRPSTATMHNRRTSVRLLFGTARRLGLSNTDPTLDVALPPRAVGSFRPLTDDEIALCRDTASWWMPSQRFSAVWAMAEAGGRGAELGAVTPADIDLEHGRVRLSGGERVEPRWAPLTNWGRQALERRLADRYRDEFVAYRGNSPGSAGRTSAAAAIIAVLTRAGLADEVDIRPTSVAAWAGRGVFDRTGDIGAAARLLGMRSLDATARMIGWDWSE